MAFLIESVAAAIIELFVQNPIEGAWNKAQRNERILRILQKVDLDPQSPPDNKFETLYAYALVEWGAFKPEELINFFRNQYTRQAFERSWQENDPELWWNEANELIQRYRESGEYTLDYNPLRELEAFSQIFDRLVTFSRTPAAARQEHTLEDIRRELGDLVQRLERWPPPEDMAELLRPYLEMVMRRCERPTLKPFDKAGQERAEMRLGRLFINLNAGAASTPFKSVAGKSGEYRAAVAHIHDNPRLILLGDPGSGKTTLLRFVALCLAGAAVDAGGEWVSLLQWQVTEPRQEWEMGLRRRKEDVLEETRHWGTPALIPILIPLRRFARAPFHPDDPQAIWRFVCQQLEQEGVAEAIPALKQAAQRGEVLFLFDGVDEVPMSQRGDVWQAIMALDDGAFGGNRWVTTCRILSFDADELPRTGLPVRTLEPLTKSQIGAFIANWFDALVETGEISRAEAKQKTGQLQTATRRQGLLSLATNPMLLTIMALVQTYYGTLPKERAKLYQACVETLLLRWQRHKEEDTQSELPDLLTQLGVVQEDLERLLWKIGWTAHNEAIEREGEADIAESEVIRIAKEHLRSYEKAEKFVEYTEQRAHLLIGRGGKKERVYGFPHRTFQEYLAACHLASQRRFGREARPLAAQGDVWREVLNLATGTLVFNQNNREKALDSIEQLMPRRPPAREDSEGWRQVWLAAEMLTVVGREAAERDEVGKEILPRLRRQLAALVETGRLSPRQRAEAGDALGRLGDERPGVCTLEPELIPITGDLTFLMGEQKQEVTVPEPFAIARYPVTNAQFRYFWEDGGYTEKWRHCWTDEGWEYKESRDWTEPRVWDNPQFNLPNQPVVGISWYEAVAYANWLAEKTGQPYRLPTEAEWERAARHTDGRKYPWGETWYDGIVNSEEAGIGRPTAVGIFPDGAAECGALDMSGNVWEWCQDEAKFIRRLKGGAYWNDKDNVPAAARRRVDPNDRIDLRGVRVVVSPFISGR